MQCIVTLIIIAQGWHLEFQHLVVPKKQCIVTLIVTNEMLTLLVLLIKKKPPSKQVF